MLLPTLGATQNNLKLDGARGGRPAMANYVIWGGRHLEVVDQKKNFFFLVASKNLGRDMMFSDKKHQFWTSESGDMIR